MTHRTILSTPFARERAKMLIDKAPDGFVATLAEPKRTTDQSNKMWAMLTDISVAKPLGRRETPDNWKAIIMAACGWDVQFLEGLDGRPFPQGFRSSQLTRSQMSTLIDWMQAWGDDNGVHWSDKQEQAA